MTLGTAIATGAFAIPHNDSWAYTRISDAFWNSGHWHLIGWNRGALVGQILLLGSLPGLTGQQAGVTVLGGAAIVLTYLLLRDTLPRHSSIFGCAVVAAAPGFGLLSTSFMTDVPALAGMLLCLRIGQHAIRHRSLPWLLGAVAAGMWALTVREQGGAAIAAVTANAWNSHADRRWRRGVLAQAGLAATAIGLFETWRSSLPNADGPPSGLAFDPLASGTGRSLLTLGLLLLPALLLTTALRPLLRASAHPRLVGAAALSAVAVGFSYATPGGPLLGNYLSRHGAYAAAAAGHRNLWGPQLDWTISAAAVLGLFLLGTRLHTSPPREWTPLTWFGVISAVILAAEAAAGQTVYDRYLIPLLPPLLATILSSHRLNIGAAFAALAGLVAISSVIAIDALTYDRASWDFGQQLITATMPADHIDAGFAWTGSHSHAIANRRRRGRPGTAVQYEGLLPDTKACLVISSSRLPSRTVIATTAYSTLLITRPHRLWALQQRC